MNGERLLWQSIYKGGERETVCVCVSLNRKAEL